MQKHRLEALIPKLVVAPGLLLGFAFIYGFMIWNGVLSVTASRMLPNYEMAVSYTHLTLPTTSRV